MQNKIDLNVKNLVIPKRIDSYLTEALSGEYSRAVIKRCLDNETIYLNGAKAKPRDLVKEGDHIRGVLTYEKVSELAGEDIPISVIYEDESIIVVDKPVGLVVQQVRRVPWGLAASVR